VALVTEISRNPMERRTPSRWSGSANASTTFLRSSPRRTAARRHRARHRQAPDLLLCDEPTGALDSQTGVLVLEAIERIHEELGTSTVLIPTTR